MVSLLGTDLTDFALSVWVLQQPGGSVSDYSMIWFFEAAPAVFLAPFIGSLVDRWSKKKMIIYGQLVAGVGSVSLLLLHYFEQLLPWHIMVVSGIGAIASLFVFRAFYVTTTALVSKDKLLRAQAITASSYAAISIGVPILAPVLYKLLGMSTIFFIDVVTFVISVVAFLFISFVVVAKSEEEFSMKKDWQKVKQFLVKHEGLPHLYLFFFIGSFLVGLVHVLFTPLILDISNEYVLGGVLATIGVGALIGGGIMTTIKAIKNPIKIMLYVYLLVGLVLASLWVDINPYVLGAGGLLIMLLFTISGVINDTFFQTVVPTKMLGRMSGFEGLVVGVSAPLAFLLSGFIVDMTAYCLKHYFPKILAYFPGSNTVAAIAIVFACSGILLIIFSWRFIFSNKLKGLDVLYHSEYKNEIKN